MLKIEPNAIYERGELKGAFPDMDQQTLTRTLAAWGARRPYPGSRKLFVTGRQILNAIEGTSGPEQQQRSPEESREKPTEGKSAIVPLRRVR